MFIDIQGFLDEDRKYFQSGKSNITIHNNEMLIKGSIIYALILIGYTIASVVSDRSKILIYMYYAFDIIHAFLCMEIFTRSKQAKRDYSKTQIYCKILEICVLTFFALEGVYASSTEHSLYIPIAIILVLLLFIHRVTYTVIISFLYVAVFAVLAVGYKTPEAASNDVSIAIATFLSALIGYYMLAKMRHKAGNTLLKYERLSKTDQLTGLYNKTSMRNICQRILDSYHGFTFLIIDMDKFKEVNDQHGHAVGDEILRAVAAAINSSFRRSDYVGRFGGDEFIAIMDWCVDDEIIIPRVEELIKSVSELEFSVKGLRVSCSIGVAKSQFGDDSHSIFKRADGALYKSKAEGKGLYFIDQS